MEPVVHVLTHGVALCGFDAGRVPRDWPPGHAWVSIEAQARASCNDCLQVLEIIEDEKDEDLLKKGIV
jgi:hypothetical protein